MGPRVRASRLDPDLAARLAAATPDTLTAADVGDFTAGLHGVLSARHRAEERPGGLAARGFCRCGHPSIGNGGTLCGRLDEVNQAANAEDVPRWLAAVRGLVAAAEAADDEAQARAAAEARRAEAVWHGLATATPATLGEDEAAEIEALLRAACRAEHEAAAHRPVRRPQVGPPTAGPCACGRQSTFGAGASCEALGTLAVPPGDAAAWLAGARALAAALGVALPTEGRPT